MGSGVGVAPQPGAERHAFMVRSEVVVPVYFFCLCTPIPVAAPRIGVDYASTLPPKPKLYWRLVVCAGGIYDYPVR